MNISVCGLLLRRGGLETAKGAAGCGLGGEGSPPWSLRGEGGKPCSLGGDEGAPGDGDL